MNGHALKVQLMTILDGLSAFPVLFGNCNTLVLKDEDPLVGVSSSSY